MEQRTPFPFWLAISLVLHAGVILLFTLAVSPRAPHEATHSKLRIDLAGMIANRQVEERKGGNAAAQPARQQANRAAPKPSPGKKKVEEAPARVERASDIPNPADRKAESAEASGAVMPAVSGAPGQGPGQRGQTIAYRDRDADGTRQYLSRLSKRLQVNLVYPEEARKSGIDGIATIAFTIMESGMIKPDSLRIQKSSGYAALDSNAMKSALASTPFEKPPKEMNVAIAVEFTVDMASRGRRASMR